MNTMIVPGPFEILILLIMTFLMVLPFWKIASKAGFPGWISLAVLVPILNLMFLFFLAFADWPALRRETSHDNPIGN